MLEGFAPIPEHPDYLISKDGLVFSTRTNRLLSIRKNNRGYLYFGVNGSNTNILLSRALARVYGGLPSLDSPLEVDHDDTDKLNNELSNLVVRSKIEHQVKTSLERGFTPLEKSNCEVCGISITSGAKRCREHYKEALRTSEISPESIEYWVSNYSWVRAAKELGLSDNGLRKRYKSLTGKDPKTIKKPS